MKKIWKFFSNIFLSVLAVIIVPILGICLIFMLLSDYVKYKKSYYYKKTCKKYTLFAATSVEFEFYNEIVKNNLPIEFIADQRDESLLRGWFVFKNTLIIPDVFDFEYDAESEKWNYYCEDEDENKIVMSLDEYIDTEIEEANRLTGKELCSNAVVLIDGSCFADNQDIAKAESRFLFYHDNRAEVIKEFCIKKDWIDQNE